jgi:hypothetical protein
MADHKKIVEGFWTRIGDGADIFPSGSGSSFLAGGDTAAGSGIHMPIFGGTLKVGAMVEPLTSQMAEYLGVQNGLMVKQVYRKSEAEAAGLKAFDVILKVGTDPISTISDWERSLHSNAGKPVQLTILRDKKQQTLTLQVDSKHQKSELELEQIFPMGDGELVAGIDANEAMKIAGAQEAGAEALREQSEALRDRLKADGIERFGPEQFGPEQFGPELFRLGPSGLEPFQISPEQAEEMRKRAEQLRESLKGFDFKIDPKQMDAFRKQMEQFRKEFKPEDFKIDPKRMDELKRRLEELKALQPGGPV